MGLLNFIFGKSNKMENEFFGTMTFFEFKREPHKNYFECSRHFKPTGKIIEIGIDGDKAGVTKEQIGFFRRIEDNYSKICQTVAPLIEKEFGSWKEGFRILDFQKEFEAVYLSLPRCETQPVIWEIAFESEHDGNHTFTLTMSDFEAKEIFIDG